MRATAGLSRHRTGADYDGSFEFPNNCSNVNDPRRRGHTHIESVETFTDSILDSNETLLMFVRNPD